MAAVSRNDISATGVLQTYLLRKTLEVFEPELYFYKMGTLPTVAAGYNTLSWAKFTQVAASSVTTGTTSSDGVTPSDTAFTATTITVTPTQYRIVVSLADLVVENNVIGFLEGAAGQVGHALARKVDSVIQTTVMAGTNVAYGGTAANRAALAATDVLTSTLLNRANAKLQSLSAPMIDGFYVAIIHPFQLYDLRRDTSAGSWLDVHKYTTPDRLYKGEIGALFGTRIVVSPNVDTFASSVTVYPALVLGKEAYGVGSFQTLQVMYTPATASDSDPLAQRRKVGAKIAFGTSILQQDAMMRLETGATAI